MDDGMVKEEKEGENSSTTTTATTTTTTIATTDSNSRAQTSTVTAVTSPVQATSSKPPKPKEDHLPQLPQPQICARPKQDKLKGESSSSANSESTKGGASANVLTMAGIHPVQKTTLDSTELILVNQDKHKYMNTSYTKVSAKMYDHNCDVKLKVDKEVFRAHKSVLSDASDYFAAMFSHDMIEKGQDAVVLHDISPRGFTAMLEYFYHGHIIVERDSIEDVLEAARFFHIEWLLQVCCDFLVRHLSMENYHNVLHLADKYFMDDLRYDIFRFVGQNFVLLSDHDKFMDLSFELFYQLLAEDYFIDATEYLIFKTIRRWVQHEPEKREEQLSALLQLVRYPLMEPEELNSIPDDVLVVKEVKELVDDAVEYHNQPHIQPLMASECTETRGAHDAVMMVTALEDANFVQYKLPDLHGFIGEQVDWSFMDSVFEFSALAVLGNFVFVSGGYDRSTYCSSTVCYRFNPRNRMWVEIAPMHQPRVSHTMCAGKKGLFVVAGIDHIVEEGHDREIILNSVEFYCVQSGCWQIMPCLPVACFSVAAAVHGEELFVSGGITDDVEDSIPTNYLRGYIYGNDAWVTYEPMLVERQGHAMVAHNHKLYVFGGHTTAQDGMTFEHCLVNETYDIETNQWTQLRDTPGEYGHIYSSAALLGNRIYLVGGKHTNRYLTSYNTEKEELEEGMFCGQLVQRLATIKVSLPVDLIQESSGNED